MILAISVGNTNIRFAGFVEGRIAHRGFATVADVGGAESPRPGEGVGARLWRSLAAVSPGEVSDVIVASVNSVALPGIEAELASRGLDPRVVGRDFALRIENRYHRPGDVGVDRLLGVLAASRLFPGEGVAVVDFGTALTINVGSPRCEFVGGLIAVGASTATAALAERTSQLPEVALRRPGGFLALDTGAAISDGVFWQVVGGVERMLRGVREECRWPVRAVATGGDAGVFAPHVEGIERVEPDLVLEGLLRAYEGRS